MKIKNFHDLAVNRIREVALMIAETGLEAIDTEAVMEKRVVLQGDVLSIQGKYISLAPIKRIFVVGAGKCSLDAAKVLERVLGERLTGGIVIGIDDTQLKKIKTFRGTHPFPSAANIEATAELIHFLSGMTEHDLVLFVISGGGSTLLCQPPSGITYENEARALKILFEKGATIEEINTLRKHLSSARGGFLAQYAYPARIISLAFSDVPGNKIELIASGPTVKDETMVDDARRILEKFDMEKELKLSLPLIETPKDEKYFTNVWNTTVVSNEIALAAMAEKAKELGFTPIIRTSTLSGEAREIGEHIVKELHEAPSRSVFLYGGEPTVTVTKPGKGGRGLELVLSALQSIIPGELVLSLASDGRDNCDFAGALCDIMTKEKALTFGLDAAKCLKENMSYYFFEHEFDYLMTGTTGSNVSDLLVGVKL
ncbi:MAG: DUF4147 domain-containing protein [Candidatus Paceibacterota bacterium]|jgi:glycerate-2-kinase